MLLHNKEKYLEEVAKYIKFPFDRQAIKDELEDHILDKIDYYIDNGHQESEAEEMALKDMGSAKDNGLLLNKEHSPLLGWAWKITNYVVIILIVMTVFSLSSLILAPFKSIEDIPKENIVYSISLDKSYTLDDSTIKFSRLVFDKAGDMTIFYEVKNKWFLASETNIPLGRVTDDLGNRYNNGSSSSMRGSFKAVGRRTYRDFSKDASKFIMTYSQYGRNYLLEIDLSEAK